MKTFITSAASAALVVFAFGTAAGQADPEEKIERKEIVIGAPERMAFMGEDAIGPHPGTFLFLSSEFEVPNKVVKNAPYSAEALTERVQNLADGNRIVHKSSSTIYRDSQGRTRREQEFGVLGPWAAAGDHPRSIFIQDPVTKTHYVLDPEEQIARKLPAKMPALPVPPAPKTPPAPPNSPELPAPGVEELEEDVVIHARPPVHPEGAFRRMMRFETKLENARKEDLGKQVIEGVKVEGTRTVSTIPAGQIGNEGPLEIVSERWYSPELQVNVMTRHYDPRFGETTYRLTSITRKEPSADLFKVPAGYKIEEARDRVVVKKKPKN